MLLKTKSETIPEINNTKQAKTCLISRTFYHEHEEGSTPSRHFCLPNDTSDHTLSRTLLTMQQTVFKLNTGKDLHELFTIPAGNTLILHALLYISCIFRHD